MQEESCGVGEETGQDVVYKFVRQPSAALEVRRDEEGNCKVMIQRGQNVHCPLLDSDVFKNCSKVEKRV